MPRLSTSPQAGEHFSHPPAPKDPASLPAPAESRQGACTICEAYPDVLTPPCGHFRKLPADVELVIAFSGAVMAVQPSAFGFLLMVSPCGNWRRIDDRAELSISPLWGAINTHEQRRA